MMKFNTILAFALIYLTSFSGKTQSLIGSWQLVKQTTCIENELPGDSGNEDLLQNMKDMHGETPQVIRFTDEQNGNETTRILNTRKNANTRHFLYKLDNKTLYILDKKSRTITETYNIDSFQENALILSNVNRACETKIFSRIK